MLYTPRDQVRQGGSPCDGDNRKIKELQMRRLLDKCHYRSYVVNEQDMFSAHSIFGPDVELLKRKTAERKEPLVHLILWPLPDDMLQKNKETVVCFDVMHVSGITFLVSISCVLWFCTAEMVENRGAKMLLTSTDRIRMPYARRRSLVNIVARDHYLASLEIGLSNAGIALNTVSRVEHAPEIKRHDRVIKERC